MRCTRCGIREATVEVRQTVNNHTENLYLCSQCAAELRSDMEYNKNALLGQMFGVQMGIPGFGGLFEADERVAVCPGCKTTSEEFLRSGFVGCPRCYEVFEPLVSRTVKKLQHSDMHVGKVPYGSVGVSDDESALRAEVDAALDRQDYALAAKLTERLNQIRQRREEKGE
ncbi:MAG: hypothetical protein J1F39_07085 [Clostridiales bacterium]|nr:hypothetical protein [Clostridiales bacterium]